MSTATSPRRRHPDPSSTNDSRRARPPKQPSNRNHNHNHNNNNPKPRPTHFLALPIGHHPELRSAISALTSSWLAHDSPIDGLDPSIVVQPRRLHLTLGVMALTPGPPRPPDRNSNINNDGERDLAGATALLASLAPRIRAVLAHSPLRVPLGRLAVMQPDPTRAHVLYVEPDLRSSDGRRLRAVCDLVHGAFRDAGFLADERRPLKVRGSPKLSDPIITHITPAPILHVWKLHCTLLNTTYRRPPPGQRRAAGRIPFSFAAFPPTSGDGSNLGTWTVDELQICEMGSWTPDGAYVRVAGCDLRPESR
ncbi:hypothetical protein BC826DRAFT_1102683 [Russula brevipes]|nr:hypothetical protein BC826DRAFT_1102683 [Russula brevipes]